MPNQKIHVLNEQHKSNLKEKDLSRRNGKRIKKFIGNQYYYFDLQKIKGRWAHKMHQKSSCLCLIFKFTFK